MNIGHFIAVLIASAVVPLVAMDELSEKSKACKQEVSVKKYSFCKLQNGGSASFR